MNALTSSPALPAHQVHRFHLRLPVLLFWALLSPLAPPLLLGVLVVCAVYGTNPFRAVAALSRVLASLKGIHLEIQTRQASIALGLF